MLGQRLKELREKQGLLQRHIAALLDVDIAYVSKIEHEEKPASRGHLIKLSKLYEVSEKELFEYWLADKVLDLIEDEKYGIGAINLVLEKVAKK
jgi:HTH-type transcriptional regulator, competence development regulator